MKTYMNKLKIQPGTKANIKKRITLNKRYQIIKKKTTYD